MKFRKYTTFTSEILGESTLDPKPGRGSVTAHKLQGMFRGTR